MHPHLFELPLPLFLLAGGAFLGWSLSAGTKNSAGKLLSILGGLALGGLIVFSQPWAWKSVAVQSYGTMVLAGFFCGVWMAARRAHQIGVLPRHYYDLGVLGVVAGIGGARAFHVLQHWSAYDPLQHGMLGLTDMFKLWDGGLVFYGALAAVIPFAWLFSRYHKLPTLPFLDLALPSVIAGQAFGRIGCFLSGCCHGKVADLPWSVHFPPEAPAYWEHLHSGALAVGAAHSLPVHPTQLYAVLAGALTAGFLYSYWPFRRYPGQLIALTLIMTGATRFAEELLRQEPAAWPAVSAWMTIAQWLSLGLLLLGGGLLLYFRRNQTRELAELPACAQISR